MPNFAGAERLGLGDYVLSHRANHKWIPLIWLPWISFYFAEPGNGPRFPTGMGSNCR